MFWRFEVSMMPPCWQCLDLVPRRKLCLVHPPTDESGLSGTNVRAKVAGFSDQVSVLVLETKVKPLKGMRALSMRCRRGYWWSHSWTLPECVSSRLLQWLPLHSGLFSKIFLPSGSPFLHRNFCNTLP